ncbi:MAG: hydrogenase maturation nickel metallochaperone HypA [Devosia sp.]|nr:hydrogenase maturation nickel metallochaperone HypA [Devosia sp.]
MHEISLCESILDIVTERAATDRFSRVTRIRLEIGPLAAVEPEALRFGFDVVMRGSIAEGARLEIESSPGRAQCLACGNAVVVRLRFDPCPVCGSDALQVRGGDTLRIREMEVV